MPVPVWQMSAAARTLFEQYMSALGGEVARCVLFSMHVFCTPSLMQLAFTTRQLRA